MSGALVASWGDVFAADATEACSIDILVASAARKGALSTTATSHASHRAWEAKRKCSYSGPPCSWRQTATGGMMPDMVSTHMLACHQPFEIP